ncbi:MAG: MBOAT family protein [Anaerolineales bacterium]|nr:MBOAT family protein [Anaerolineales bacterium]MBX3036930.1 MBOAT family protein [Anaerolineales bacterium]
MTITQILIIVFFTLLLAILKRGRDSFLLIASILTIFWLQPALPIRGFDFWIPIATLIITIFTWLITADNKLNRKNIFTLVIIAGIILLLNATRYFSFAQILTPSRPPQIEITLIIFLIFGFIFFLLMKYNASFLTFGLILLLSIFLILKISAWTIELSSLLRALNNQSLTNVSAFDIRWLGFSYVAFRLIHTIRDKQAGRLPSIDLSEYITYVIFFPAFTAGPIDRIERFIKDLRQPFAGLNTELFFSAGQRLLIGLFKKFVIADTLALIALNDTNATQVQSTGWMWVLVYAYAFQIYFDFSGYTDIALGIAKFIGINLPENFSSPYLKPNLTQFWNNWHMTLTQWFRAYFFNPITRWLRSWQKPLSMAMMILLTQVATMLLIGFWHGVTWNFTIWGLWHGLGLFIHNRWNDFTKAKSAEWANTSFRQSLLNVSGIIFTFHFVALGWIFFALSSPVTSWQVILKLFGVN